MQQTSRPLKARPTYDGADYIDRIGNLHQVQPVSSLPCRLRAQEHLRRQVSIGMARHDLDQDVKNGGAERFAMSALC